MSYPTSGEISVSVISDAEKIFEDYLKGYIEAGGDDLRAYNKEMKQDIKMARDIIAKIKAFRERMEELHGRSRR